MEWYGRSMDAGFPPAFRDMGYLKGEPVPYGGDPEEAFSYFLKGADLGDAESMYCIGGYLAAGTVEGALGNPMTWFEKSGEAGCWRAQMTLASMFHHGDGKMNSPEKAEYWYGKALVSRYSREDALAGISELLLSQGREDDLLEVVEDIFDTDQKLCVTKLAEMYLDSDKNTRLKISNLLKRKS